ncbi:MAG: DUF523 domain-containing protein [Nonlabens ulvanivorans]|uniref:DUF523 domain-containing protein n=1 Tax=Nonlabens ulvanivorans TaxID=906888 RepID=UPI003263AC9D
MHKILISACFMGENVRYDGGHQSLFDHELFSKKLKQWQQEGRLVSACPECLGGLATPRAPAEIQQNSQKIITNNNVDVSENFNQGAQKTLALCLKHDIKYALLKESSPSCGSQLVYDGTFTNTKVNGQGITAKLLTQHHIKVFSEKNIAKLITELDKLT